MSLSKEEIIKDLRSCSDEFISFCASIHDDSFFHQPSTKWSIAQNVKHLVISATTTRLAFILPKFIVRLYTGRPNRSSRSYDELVNKYKLKLQQGGKASGIYIPKTINPQTGKENMLNDFSRTMNRLISSIQKNYRDDQLDQFLAPHPLLGKITLRELCYFTIYHTQHHLNIIKERGGE
ncbi:DinB family protein [Terrimonas pollutisoli]|uniref:DinB family protein n=1 Tax=Terrimonas pollutisoli TaxID=3034147 RepID=UPI0023EAD05D|nr:DinB family protein [Terrimonas sp. H1YJ31]